jgi:hypothetical protein
MISRRNANRNTSLITRIEEKCHALVSHRVDDNVDFRRACVEGKLALIPVAFDLIHESPKAGLTERKRSAADDDHMMRDDIMVEMVYQALNDTSYGQLRKLQVCCVKGRITLTGCLPTYYLKQLAQSVTRSVTGVLKIENDVEVVSPG